MRAPILLISILIFAISCKNQIFSIQPVPEPGTNSYAMVAVDSIHINLDSSTTPDVETINFIKTSYPELSFYNKFLKKIYFYNSVTAHLTDTINLNTSTLPKPIDVLGHYKYTDDSIFLVDSWKSTIYLVNKVGNVRDSFKLTLGTDKKIYSPTLYLSGATPMSYFNGNLYVTGSSFGEFKDETETNRPCIIMVNLKTRKSSFLGSFSDIYRLDGANWGGANYRAIFSAFDKGGVLLSFPADHFFYRYDLTTGKKKTIYGGSKYFDSIPSFQASSQSQKKLERSKHYGLNGSYASIIFDPYRNFYYRIAEMPLKDYVEGIREKMVKQFSIVILDSTLNKVGETLIPHLSHSRISFFVDTKGLQLQKYNKTEDYITFTTFIPKLIRP